jgi:hypothetical protein
MSRIISVIFLFLLPLFSFSCTRDTTFTVSAANHDKILVAKDKATMEYLIDCSITHNCERVPVMSLLYDRQVFILDGGSKVTLTERFLSFSHAKRVHVLEGAHTGQDGWVYDRMLFHDRSLVPYQLAFARLSRPIAD